MAHIDLHSKAFRKGFLDGFTAYYAYFRPQSYSRAKAIDPSLAKAWIDVGAALRVAEYSERGTVGKKSRKSSVENVGA